MKKAIGVFCACFSFFWAQSPANATVPQLMPVQGVLADGAGVPVDGATTLTFSIYSGFTDTIPAWQEIYDGTDAVDVEDGFFTVYLGSLDPTGHPLVLDYDAEALWLGIRVGVDDEMPRIRLASVPFALEAQVCRQIGDIDEADAQHLADLLDNGCDDGYYVQGFDSDGALICGVDDMAAAGTVASVTGTSPITASTVGGAVTVGVSIGTASGTVAAGDHNHAHNSLTGLAVGDPHTQYFALAQNETVTGAPTFSGATAFSSTATFSGATAFNGGTSSVSAPFTVDSTYLVTDLNTDYLDGHHASDFVPMRSCTTGYVLKWDGDSWECGDDLVAAGGSVTAVNGTAPITASTVSGVVTVGVTTGTTAGTVAAGNHTHAEYFNLSENENVAGTPAFNGGGSNATTPFTVSSNVLVSHLNADLLDGYEATYFAASGHVHSGYMAALTCSEGNVLKWSGSAWACGTDNAGAGTITSVSGTSPITASTVGGAVTVGVTTGTTAGTVATGNHNHDAAYVNVTGDSMTGALSIATASASALSATTSNSGGDGVFGSAGTAGNGVHGIGGGNGVYGYTGSAAGYGVLGISGGTSAGATGVRGVASGTTGTNYGVFGSVASSSGYGVYAENTAAGGVALGTTGDALIGGIVTADEFDYPTPQTGYVSVHPTAFFPGSDSVSYGTAPNGAYRYLVNGAATSDLYAPISLPDGVSLTSLSCWVTDNSTATDYKYVGLVDSINGQWVCISDPGTSGVSATMQTVTSSCSEIVDNSRKVYFLRLVHSNTTDSSNCWVYGCSVAYTYTSEGR